MFFERINNFLLALILTPLFLFAFNGGNGTLEDPFQITSIEQLDSVRFFCGRENYGKHFKLMNDIDLTNWLSEGQPGYNSGAFWLPIGDDTKKFYGTFDGNRKKIRGIRIDRPTSYYVGVFGCIGNGSSILNVGVEVDTITGYYMVGGIVGRNDTGTINNSYAIAKINGYRNVGGLVGVNSRGMINCCYAKGSVHGNGGGWCGGLIGSNSGTLSNCFAMCKVSGSAGNGGLIGINSSRVENCYAAGAVSGSMNVGGLVGSDMSNGWITNCFWDKMVCGQDSSSGSPASSGRTTQNLKSLPFGSSPPWTLTGTRNGGYPSLQWQEVDGFSGGDGSISNPLKITTAGQLDSVRYCCDIRDSGVHFIVMDNIDLSNYLASGNPGYNNGEFWLPIGGWRNKFYGKFDGSNYQITGFKINRPDSNYVGLFGIIGRGAELKNIHIEVTNGERVKGDHYVGVLVGSSDTGTIQSCVTSGEVSGYCAGGIAGKNYGDLKSSHSSCTVGDSVAIGGIVGENFGTINDCYSYSTAKCIGYSPYCIAGLAGRNYGSIINSFSTGVINASGYSHETGGIAGENFGTIHNCYAKGDISGYMTVGGLVGYNRGIVSNSFSTGLVSGRQYIGGLSGGNSRIINKSYSKGMVTGILHVGGLVGSNIPAYPDPVDSATVKNSYAIGKVLGRSCVGGLAGRNYGVVDSCFAVGFVSGTDSIGGLVGRNAVDTGEGYAIDRIGIVRNSYWDKQATGQLMSDGSDSTFGKNTEQMITQSVYVNWDFTDIWAIYPEKNYGYPYFKWQTEIVLSPPFLLFPLNNAENIPITTKFIWKKFSDDQFYTLQVSELEDFSSMLVNYSSIYDTTLTIGIGTLSSNTTYYWRVQATKTGGVVTEFTSSWSFTTNSQSTSIINPGWNMISFNVQPSDSSAQAVFDSIRGFVFAKNNTGRVYWPIFDINTIGSINTGSGYKVYCDSLDTLHIQGSPIDVSTTPVTLDKGWNLIAYFPQMNMPINAALSSVASQMSLVKDNSGQVYMPELAINTIGDMKVGQGYKIYMKNDAILTYPTVTLLKAVERDKNRQPLLPCHYLCKYNTGSNATALVTQVSNNGVLAADNSEIGAFDEQGNLIGNGVIKNGKTAVCIWGDDPQTKVKDGCIEGEKITFKFWDGNQESNADCQSLELVNYREDDIFTIAFSVTTRLLIKDFGLRMVSANPFKKSIMVSFEVPTTNDNTTQNVKINIFDLNGCLIRQLTNKKYPAGHYYVKWDAEEDKTPGSNMYIMQMKTATFDKKIKLFRMK